MDEKDIDEGQNDDNIENNILIPRRVVFVIDRSGSMRGIKWDKTISSTIIALKQLRNGHDKFCIILCGNAVKLYPSKEISVANTANINKTISYLKSQEATGCELINASLLKAIELIKNDIILLNQDNTDNNNYNFYMNQVLLLTDGRPTIGETDTNKIIVNVKNANDLSKIDKYSSKISVHSFGIGRDSNDSGWVNDLNHSFLKILSINNHGIYQRVKQTTADKELCQFFKILSRPILSNINVIYKNKDINNLTQTKFNTLYDGNDLIICGKIENIQNMNDYNISATISAITGKQIKQNNKLMVKPITISKQIKVITNINNLYGNTNNIERIWAYLKLQQFAKQKLIHSDMIQLDDDEKEEHSSMPLSLALKYKFVTPWTSMIVVKKKDDSEQKEEPQQQQQQQPQPQQRHDDDVRARMLRLSAATGGTMLATVNMDEIKKQKTMAVDGLKKNKTIWINGPTPPFDDHFKKLKQFGEPGQFGIIYRCEQKKTKKRYAVKLLNKNRFYRIPHKYRPRYLRAMHDEIDILSTLSHPNIIKLHNLYEDKTTFYIVMEECFGGTLFQGIAEKGQYTEHDASKVTKQLLSALQYMHQENQIVHCDLKPDNILFLDKSDDSLIKIMDFGMSKIFPRLQYLTHLCDTPYYTAPEVINNKKYNHAADMWSIGIILYIIIFGYPPFVVDPEKYGKHERKALYEKIKRGFIARVRSTEKHGFGPWFPDHIPVSQEIKHLISKLLEFKVRNRYTAHEALQHPWIVNQGKSAKKKDVDPQRAKSVIQSLQKFNNTYQFKAAVIKLFREQFKKMRPSDFYDLEQSFIKMDTDGDGLVSYQQFENAVSNVKTIIIEQKYIQQIFENVNNDQKQRNIRFTDLLNALVHDYLVSCDETLYAVFRKLDDDDDGKITTQQFKEKLKEYDVLGEWDRAIQICNEQGLGLNDFIDYEEFLLNLHPNFEESTHWLPDIFQKMKSLAFVTPDKLGDNDKQQDEEKDSNNCNKINTKKKKMKSNK